MWRAGTDYSADKYPVCGGHSQSPINIEPASTEYKSYGSFVFKNYDSVPNYVSLKLENKGHTGR